MSSFHEWIYKKILKEPSKKTKSKTLRLGPLAVKTIQTNLHFIQCTVKSNIFIKPC